MQCYLELISEAALRALKQSFRITHRKSENTADPVYLSHMLLNHLVNQGNILRVTEVRLHQAVGI